MTNNKLKVVLEKHQKWLNKQKEGVCANLSGANLRNADLRNANLHDVDLSDVKNIPFLPQLIICPPEGSFTAYKKLANSCVAKLLIPEDAKRSNATTRKCRCDKALVVAIYDNNGNEVKYGVSNYNNTFHYEVGQMVRVDNFDENRWNECSTGIHFFMSKQEAIDY